MASRARVHAYPGVRADGADAGARGAQAAVSMSLGMGIVAAARRGTARVDLFHLEHTRRVEPLEDGEGGRGGGVRMAFLMSKRVGAGDVQALQFLDPGAEVLAVVVDNELKVFQLGFRAWFGAVASQVASPLAQSPVLWQLRTRVELGKLVDKPRLVALAAGREDVSGKGKFWIATAFSSGEIARFKYDHNLSARELASHKTQIQLASTKMSLASCTFCPQGRHVLILTLEEGRAAYVDLGEEKREEDSEPQAQRVGLGLHWVATQWIKPGETALLVRRDGMRKLVSVPSGAERVSYQTLCANAQAQWLLPLRLETADAGFWIMGGFTPPGVQGSHDEQLETKLHGFRRFDRPASAVVDILRRGMHSIAGGSILGATNCRFEENKVPPWAIESGASAKAEFAVLVLTEVGISFVFVDRDECATEETCPASLSTKENVHSQQQQRHPKPISGQARKGNDGRKSDKAPPHRQSKASPATKRDIGKLRVEKPASLGSQLAGTVRSLETRVKQAELDLCRLRTEFVAFTQEMSSSLDELASLVGAQTSQTNCNESL